MDDLNCHRRVASILCAIWLIGFTALVQAQNFNVDLGDSSPTGPPPGPPSSAFGAAANQPGVWNVITTMNATNLNDLSGNPTTAQLTVTASTLLGNGGSHTGDLKALLDDNFFASNGTSWSLSISGLTNGMYDFYYYAPSNAAVDTGPFTVNGIAAASITGDDHSALTEGLNWEVVPNVTVSGGALTVSSTSTSGVRGLAGFQLVFVPEPTAGLLLAIGGILVAITFRKRNAL